MEEVEVKISGPSHLVGAEAVRFSVVLDREAVVEQETVVALLAVRVVHLCDGLEGWRRARAKGQCMTRA